MVGVGALDDPMTIHMIVRSIERDRPCLFPDSVVYCTYLKYRKMILCVLCVSAMLSVLWDANSCADACRDSNNNSKSIL